MNRSDALKVLNLNDNQCDIKSIRYNYKKLALSLHPDRKMRNDNSNHSNKAISNSTFDFHQIQQAFDFLLCGKQQESRTLFKVAHGGQSISAIGEDIENVQIGMGIGDEEESITASVTFTTCPLCLKAFKVGRAFRAHLQSKSHGLTAATVPLTLEKAMELAVSNFTVTATSNYMVAQDSASVGLQSKGRPMLLDQQTEQQQLQQKQQQQQRQRRSKDQEQDKETKQVEKETEQAEPETKTTDKTKQHHQQQHQHQQKQHIYKALELERARERACTKASAAAATASVRAWGSGAGNRANAKLSHEGLTACRDGDLKAVQQLVEKNQYDMNTDVGPNGETGVHWAAGSGHVDVILYLVEIGGIEQLNKRDTRSGRNGIHWAARNGHRILLEFMEQHWKKHINFDCLTFDGTSALQLACYAGKLSTVTYLIEQGCNVNWKNNYGCNSLFFSCIGAQFEISKYLYEKCQVDAFAIQNQGHSALHKAAYTGSKDICIWLQDVVGLDKTCVLEDRKCHTARDLARIKGFYELADILIRWQ